MNIKGYSRQHRTKKARETSHVSLSEEELQILTELELSERLNYYRDLF